MTLFNTAMQNEKIAIIALALIIFGALSIYIASLYSDEIIDNLFPEEKIIETGDCVDVNYIGKLVDGEIFDSSYADLENKTDGTPLKVFVTLDSNETSPMSGYSSGLVQGFMEGLIGLKKGETKTIGPIPPEKAYGTNKLSVGDTFTTSMFTGSEYDNAINMALELISHTDEQMILKWINIADQDKFTMPEYIIMEDLENAYLTFYDPIPPYYLWENSSEIITISDESVLIKTTPTKTENLTEQTLFLTLVTKAIPAFPNTTTADWNDTTITITSTPEIGNNYSATLYGQSLSVLIHDVNDTHINTTIYTAGQVIPYSFNRTIEFNRTYTMRRLFIIPTLYQMILQTDVENAGYTLHELAGQELIFEVTIEEVYKTSQS